MRKSGDRIARTSAARGVFFGVSVKRDAYRAEDLLAAMQRRRPACVGTSIVHRRFACLVQPGLHTDCCETERTFCFGSLQLTHGRALRADLGLPKDCADIEAVAACYQIHGVESVTRLKGDFALVIWDESRECLTMMRDRLGLKQLYLAETDDFLAFSGQPDPLFALPGVSFAFDEGYLAEYLALLLPPADVTFYRDIRRLAPATHLVLKGGHTAHRQYWQADLTPLRLAHRADYHAAFREQLGRAVAERLDGCRPTAVFLSGGLDSTALAATAVAQSPNRVLGLCCEPPATFDYRDGPGWEAEERRYVAALQRQVPALDVTFETVADLHPFAGLDAHFETTELPPHAPNNRPWIDRLLAKAAGAGAGTVMVGQLGNLAMSWDGAGYLGDLVRRGQLRALWREFRARRVSGAAWLKSELVWPLLPHRARQMLRLVKHGRAFSPLNFAAIDPDLARRVDLDARYHQRMNLTQRDGGRHDMAWYWEGVQCYAANLSTVWTAQARQHGLAFCDPCADVDLVTFCLRIPLSLHQQRGRKRLLVREALAQQLPAEVVQRRTRGRQAPHTLSYCRTILPELEAACRRYAALPATHGIIDWPRVSAALPQLHAPSAGFGEALFVLRALTAAAFLDWHHRRATAGLPCDSVLQHV